MALRHHMSCFLQLRAPLLNSSQPKPVQNEEQQLSLATMVKITTPCLRRPVSPIDINRWAEEFEQVDQEKQFMIDLRPFVVRHGLTVLCQKLDIRSDATYNACVKSNQFLSEFAQKLPIPANMAKYLQGLDKKFAKLLHSDWEPLDTLYRTLELRELAREKCLCVPDVHDGAVNLDQFDIIHISADDMASFEAADHKWTFLQYHVKCGLLAGLTIGGSTAVLACLPQSIWDQVGISFGNSTSNFTMIPTGTDIVKLVKWVFALVVLIAAWFHAGREAASLRESEAWKLAQSIAKMQEMFDDEMGIQHV